MKNKKIIILYSISHFIVDFLCANFMIGQAMNVVTTNSNYIISIIIYNFFAFAFQVPLGMVMDALKIYKYISIIGALMILLTYLEPLQNAILLATILGIGNALFHLEGGTNVYFISNKKAKYNGICVAPGAMGIFLGTYFANKINYLISFLCIVLLIIILIYIQQFLTENTKNESNYKLSNIKSTFLISILISLSIVIRSLGSGVINYTWKNTFILSFLYTLSIVVGKAIGGILGDKYGFSKIACGSLLISIVLLLLGYKMPFIAYIGILLFNIPMAITLTMLVNTLGNGVSTAVGLNTMFLFIGFIFNFINISYSPIFILLISNFIAIISIFVANQFIERSKKYEKNFKNSKNCII